MSQERLPGMPRKRLVADVKRTLRSYGIRVQQGRAWEMTWTWAYEVARSYMLRTTWPLASEIATQYLVCVMADMKADCMLKLPYRAGQHVPPQLQQKLAGPGKAPLQLEAI